MAPPIRLLTARDIPDAMRLKEAAGWNQTEQDWRNVLELEPEGCFAIEMDGAVQATATAVCYGTRLAWIGMVLTHPDYRGRGLARALMEHAIAWLRARGVEWIKLDATDMGRPLYERLGFVAECAVERWAATAPAVTEPRPSGSGRTPPALDVRAVGADRSKWLDHLARQGSSAGRPGTKAAYFGPCVCTEAAEARERLCAFLAAHPGERIFWDVLPHNTAASELAREFGFAPLRQLVRMALPGPGTFAHDDHLVYAIAGFEFG